MTAAGKGLMATLRLNPSRIYLDRVAAEAGELAPDKSFRVLDAGSGTAPYRHHFARATYETADLMAVDKEYAQPTYVCDLADIPVEDGRFDLVFCSQTLEHLPDPLAVLRELHRVLKPGGQLWITAPLGYPEHEAPYDYYRYTRYGLEYLAEQAGFSVKVLQQLEGYYATLSHQLFMAAKFLPAIWFPVKAVFVVLGAILAWRDLKHPLRIPGIAKNYHCVLVAEPQA